MFGESVNGFVATFALVGIVTTTILFIGFIGFVFKEALLKQKLVEFSASFIALLALSLSAYQFYSSGRERDKLEKDIVDLKTIVDKNDALLKVLLSSRSYGEIFSDKKAVTSSSTTAVERTLKNLLDYEPFPPGQGEKADLPTASPSSETYIQQRARVPRKPTTDDVPSRR